MPEAKYVRNLILETIKEMQSEIGYYANATDTMQKILTLDKIDDFNQYHLAGDGALNYVRDAELAKQTVTVKFANEAGERLSTQDVFYYGTLTQPADPTKEIAGYQATFLGWYNGDQKWNFDTPVLKEIVLVAKFEVSIINYTVTFVADGATVDTATYNVENSTITAPAVPAKEGYTGAWEAYTLTTGDVTVNAVYTVVETPDDGSNSDKPSIELPEIADKVLGKFGCSNAIGGVSATFALLVVAGILLKKKED